MINAFIEKLSNWRRKVQKGNFSMFSSLVDISNLDDDLKTNVAQQLEKLECEFKTCFSKISRDDLSLARNPFRLSSEKVKDELQDQFIDMKNDSSCQNVFESLEYSSHGFLAKNSIVLSRKKQNCSKKATAIQLYIAMRICLFNFLNVKTKQQNRLEIKQDICCSLSSTESRIKNLVANVQAHSSH